MAQAIKNTSANAAGALQQRQPNAFQRGMREFSQFMLKGTIIGASVFALGGTAAIVPSCGANINITQNSITTNFNETRKLQPGDTWEIPLLGSSLFSISRVGDTLTVRKGGQVNLNVNTGVTSHQSVTITENKSDYYARFTVTVRTSPTQDPTVTVSGYTRLKY